MLYWIHINFKLNFILRNIIIGRSRKIYEKLVHDLSTSMFDL